MSMPARLTADTGVDALTHAVEAYVSRRANPVSDAFALSAIRTISANLRRVFRDGEDRDARAAMMSAATLAGMAFSNSSVALVHGMSRPIGADFDVAHGLSNAMLFPAVTAFSVLGAPRRYAECARAYGVAEDGSDEATAKRFVNEIITLCHDLRVPTPRSYGIDEQFWDQKIPLMGRSRLWIRGRRPIILSFRRTLRSRLSTPTSRADRQCAGSGRRDDVTIAEDGDADVLLSKSSAWMAISSVCRVAGSSRE